MKQGLKFGVSLSMVSGLVALVSLSACSGGSPSASASAGGASGSGSASASGTVTGFGSILVNGKKFETENVEVRHDSITEQCAITSDPAKRCGLKEGMTVKVRGTFSGSSYRASTIVQEDILEGPISAQPDLANSRFTVLGQTVLVDETTKFDDSSAPNKLNSLNVGDVVEVSGLVKADGVIAATFIERKGVSNDCSAECEVKGTVKGHSAIAKTFQIGVLTVNYSTATISDMPPPVGSNWDDLFVEVKGSVWDSGTNTLTATKVEPEGFQAPDGDQVALEGFVTSVAGMPASFVLGSTTIQLSGGTVFLGGLSSDISVGQKLQVEGTISNNVIAAAKVKFQDAVRIESNVASNPTSSSMTLEGLPGITVVVNSQTVFKGVSNLAGIDNGDNLRIRGREGASNTVIATEVEWKSASPNSDIVLQGVVQSAVNPSVTILGLPINTSGLQLRDINDSLVSPSVFFSALLPNQTVVKSKGQLIGILPSAQWEEMELESE